MGRQCMSPLILVMHTNLAVLMKLAQHQSVMCEMAAYLGHLVVAGIGHTHLSPSIDTGG